MPGVRVSRVSLLLLVSLSTAQIIAAQPPAPSTTPNAAKVLSAQGVVQREQPPWVAVGANAWLTVGAKVRTGDQSRAVLLLVDETQLKLNANTEVQLANVRDASTLFKRVALAANTSQESVLALSKGQAWLRARNKPADVKVVTPAVTAAIRGTEFDLRVGADGESVITVLEGSVDFRNDFGAVLVNTGEQGRARVGEAPTKTVLLNPADAVQWTLVYSGAVSARDFPLRFASAAAARTAAPAATGLEAAEAKHDAGDPAGALQALGDLATPAANALRGWIFLEQNRPADALGAFDRASDSPRVRLGRSMAAYRLGRFDDAYRAVQAGGDSRLVVQKAQLDLVSGDAVSARAALAAIAESDPAYAEAQSLLADVYLVQDRKDEARRAAQQAVAAAPESPTAYLALSRVEQSAFRLPAAMRAAARARALDPDFVQANIQYANLLFGSGATGEAERIIDQVLGAAPDEAMAHSSRGFIRLAQGGSVDAIASFTRSLALDSAQGEPHLGLGIVAMREGRYEDAVSEFLAAAALEPRRSIYQTYLAKALYELRRFDQSFTALKSAELLDPRDPTPHLYGGIFDNDLVRPGEAVREFDDSIRLNDGRAVYRSRFLLDEDLATRNVNLATAYDRLGLTEWANAHAIASELADPGDSATHLFLADTFSNLDGRLSASGGELLLARLLMPANVNSFNSLNNYTTLFERLQANWAVTTGGGSFDQGRASANAYGGTRRIGYSSLWSYSRTDGFRTVNDDRHDTNGATLFKFGLTPHTDLLLTYVHGSSRQGDHGGGLSSLVGDNNNPTLRWTTRIDRGEVGYHAQLRPGSEFVAYLSGETDRIASDDPRDYKGLLHTMTTDRSPYFSYQAAHLLKVSAFQFRYGVDVYQGHESSTTTSNFWASRNPPLEIPFRQQSSSDDVRYRTAFAQTTVAVSPRLSFVAGMNYDWANHNDTFVKNDRPMSRWDPTGGILFRPFNSATVRFAAMRVLQTDATDRLAPTHIVGFPLEQNEVDLARSTTYNVGWDQRLGRDTFLRGTAFRRHRDVPAGSACALVSCSNDFSGGELVVNRLLTERWTLVPGYSVADATDLFGSRRDNQVNVATYYVHPRGFTVGVRENYLHQRGMSDTTANQVSVFTTGVSLSYELPRKRGLLAVSISNLTDQRYTFLADPLALDSRIPRRAALATMRVNF